MTTAILTLLVVCYGAVIVAGHRNTRDFLIRQHYYKNLLFSSFYLLCLLLCLARTAEYVYLITTYWVKSMGSGTLIYFILDALSNTLMVLVGIILVLKILNVTSIFKGLIGHRRSLPRIPLLMGLLLALVCSAVIVTAVLQFDLTYYTLAVMQFAVCVALLTAMYRMFAAMSKFPVLDFY